jgi:hypothetical protein
LEEKIFVSSASVGEIGTSRASMNRTGKTNATKGVKNFYNEYHDFHQCEIEGHICASFMEMSGMKAMDGTKAIFYLENRKSKMCDCIKRVLGGMANPSNG